MDAKGKDIYRKKRLLTEKELREWRKRLPLDNGDADSSQTYSTASKWHSTI